MPLKYFRRRLFERIEDGARQRESLLAVRLDFPFTECDVIRESPHPRPELSKRDSSGRLTKILIPRGTDGHRFRRHFCVANTYDSTSSAESLELAGAPSSPTETVQTECWLLPVIIGTEANPRKECGVLVGMIKTRVLSSDFRLSTSISRYALHFR